MMMTAAGGQSGGKEESGEESGAPGIAEPGVPLSQSFCHRYRGGEEEKLKFLSPQIDPPDKSFDGLSSMCLLMGPSKGLHIYYMGTQGPFERYIRRPPFGVPIAMGSPKEAS